MVDEWIEAFGEVIVALDRTQKQFSNVQGDQIGH